MRSFIVRVALIATVLAIPIVGTSYMLVNAVRTDIAMAYSERTTLANIERMTTLFSGLEQVRRSIDDGDRPATERARHVVDRSIAELRHAYGRPDRAHETDAFWMRLDRRWNDVGSRPTIASLGLVYDALKDAGNALEPENSLDLDPSSAVQYISDTVLRRIPRSIVALRHTDDAVAAASRSRFTRTAAERIASNRALESQSLSDESGNLAYATVLDPTLVPRLRPAINAATALTTANQRRVDALLVQLDGDRGTVRAINAGARRAIAAHLALWRAGQAQAGRLVEERLTRQIARRRIIIALAALAVLAGAIAVTLVSRYEARRDRIELAAAKLEGEKLRSEVSKLSVERALRLQEAQFRTVFENADLGIAIFDEGGKIVQYNSAVAQMLGAHAQTVLDAMHDAVVQFQRANHQQFTQDESRVAEDGRPQWLSLTFSGVYDQGACQMVIVLIRDATEERILAQQLAYDANHDSLTGLTNRAAMERAISESLTSGREDAPSALMYIDLDKFKPINDAFGHRAGDHVLVTVAERLRGAVGAHDVCARLGGDEFAILLRGVAAPATLEAIARRVEECIAEPIVYDADIELSVTASIGISIGSPRYQTADQLKHDADIALYAVKERGRNGHLIHQDSQPFITS